MNFGKGITWLAFVVVLNLVSPQKTGNTVDAVRAWAGFGTPANVATPRSAPIRTVRADSPVRGAATPGLCAEWLQGAPRPACAAVTTVDSRTPVWGGQWRTAR